MLFIIRAQNQMREAGMNLVEFAVALGVVAIVVIVLAALVGAMYGAAGFDVPATNPVNWLTG